MPFDRDLLKAHLRIFVNI